MKRVSYSFLVMQRPCACKTLCLRHNKELLMVYFLGFLHFHALFKSPAHLFSFLALLNPTKSADPILTSIIYHQIPHLPLAAATSLSFPLTDLMAKMPGSNLEIVGTARKPNNSDLRHRGLTGLPDPSPEVAARRAELESQQEELKARVATFQGEGRISFMRTKIDVSQGADEAMRVGWEMSESTDGGNSVAEEKISNSAARINPPELPVAGEACESQMLKIGKVPLGGDSM